MKRVLFLLAVALVPLVAFAGGAAETKGGIPSLRFAHTWGEGDAKGPYFGPALAKFAAAHAGEFTIVTETASGDNMFNKIQVDLAVEACRTSGPTGAEAALFRLSTAGSSSLSMSILPSRRISRKAISATPRGTSTAWATPCTESRWKGTLRRFW